MKIERKKRENGKIREIQRRWKRGREEKVREEFKSVD